jgi:hypothetical protein
LSRRCRLLCKQLSLCQGQKNQYGPGRARSKPVSLGFHCPSQWRTLTCLGEVLCLKPQAAISSAPIPRPLIEPRSVRCQSRPVGGADSGHLAQTRISEISSERELGYCGKFCPLPARMSRHPWKVPGFSIRFLDKRDANHEAIRLLVSTRQVVHLREMCMISLLLSREIISRERCEGVDGRMSSTPHPSNCPQDCGRRVCCTGR